MDFILKAYFWLILDNPSTHCTYLNLLFCVLCISYLTYFHLGSLVEFDPLCLPLDNDMKSINVISLDESEVKAPVLLREIRPLEEHEFELLRPLSPQVKHLFNFCYYKQKTKISKFVY